MEQIKNFMRKLKVIIVHRSTILWLKKCVVALACLFTLGVVYNTILVSNGINLGGFTGLAQALEEVADISYTKSLFLLNIIPFAYAFAKKQWAFFSSSIATTFILGIFIDKFPRVYMNLPAIPSIVVGSVIAGIVFGILCRIGTSSGGIDMFALNLSKKTDMTEGTIMKIFDTVVVVVWFFATRSILATLSSLLATYLLNSVIDFVLRWDENPRLTRSAMRTLRKHLPLPRLDCASCNLLYRQSAVICYRYRLRPFSFYKKRTCINNHRPLYKLKLM